MTQINVFILPIFNSLSLILYEDNIILILLDKSRSSFMLLLPNQYYMNRKQKITNDWRLWMVTANNRRMKGKDQQTNVHPVPPPNSETKEKMDGRK